MVDFKAPFDGVMFFPVTPFDDRDRVAVDVLDEHIGGRLDHGPAAVFAACGTGEYHALSVSEYRVIVERAVAVTQGRVPVFGGTGGPLGHAREIARAAEESGVDALLVMPPYLVNGPQAGLIAYIEAIAASTALPLVVYHRGSAAFTAASVTRLLANPQVVGIKDGVGDVALAQEFVLLAEKAGRGDILFFNGLLTAELTQAAYRAVGVPLYSSATFAMAPQIANGFYRAYAAHDEVLQRAFLADFYTPLVHLRDEVPGFAVALIKAGLRLGGLAVGSVRAPLRDPDAAQEERLARILERGHELAG